MTDHFSLQVRVDKKEAIPLDTSSREIGTRGRHGVTEWGYPADCEQ